MKKIILPVFFIIWVLVLAGIKIIQPGNSAPSFLEYIFVGALLAFFILGIYPGLERIISNKQGLPAEDELSKKVTRKAAVTSFYLSLFLWLVIIFIQNHG